VKIFCNIAVVLSFFIVSLAPQLISLYCSMPTELSNHTEEGFAFDEVPVSSITAGRYDELDKDCLALVMNSVGRKPWRLYVHQPCDRWVNGLTCILGDAAHPMPVSGPAMCVWAVLTRSSISGGVSSDRGCGCARPDLFTPLWTVYAGRECRSEDVVRAYT